MRPPWRDRQYRELKKLFFRPPVSVPLISLDQYRTERYSDDCMAHLGVPRGIRAYRARTGAGARNLKPREPVSVNRKPETYHNSEAETCNLQPTHPPMEWPSGKSKQHFSRMVPIV